jgi:hypothetical protein
MQFPRAVKRKPTVKAPMTKGAVALLVLAACGGNNSYSPTAPPAPSPPPTVSSVTASYSLEAYRDSGGGVEAVQVLLDGVVVCTGGLGSYWDPYDVCNGGDLGSLAVGRHTLSFRVTSQGVSPTSYEVHARVVVIKRDGATEKSQGASWDEEVTLATGSTWTGAFDIREWAG